ncbi:hypothetical protein GJ496_008404, partial [Pomphorhynchus laevis]
TLNLNKIARTFLKFNLHKF